MSVWNRTKWNFDPVTGEWKRILYRSGDRVLVDSRSHQERRTEELVRKQERRRWLTYGIALFLFAKGLSLTAEGTDWSSPFFYWLMYGFSLFIVVPLLGLEFLYQTGAQWIKGAKVLDPEPVRPGKKEVEEQKAHGDARLATETETKSAASGAGRRSSVHDQEF